MTHTNENIGKMSGFIGYLKLLRGRACSIPLAFGLLAAIVGIKVTGREWSTFAFIAGLLVSYITWSGHQVWNDIFDQKLDKLAGLKDRPLVSGKVTMRSAVGQK